MSTSSFKCYGQKVYEKCLLLKGEFRPISTKRWKSRNADLNLIYFVIFYCLKKSASFNNRDFLDFGIPPVEFLELIAMKLKTQKSLIESCDL